MKAKQQKKREERDGVKGALSVKAITNILESLACLWHCVQPRKVDSSYTPALSDSVFFHPALFFILSTCTL